MAQTRARYMHFQNIDNNLGYSINIEKINMNQITIESDINEDFEKIKNL